MIDNWDELVVQATPLLDFLQQPSLFMSAYSGTRDGHLVFTDASMANQYASDDSLNAWDALSDCPDVFPGGFEWKRWIDHHLRKTDYFGLSGRNFCGADVKWMRSVACPLVELMRRDMRILLNCYANQIFPPLWESILGVYLKNGFPCGLFI